MKRDRLGKGLGALLGEYLEPDTEGAAVRALPVGAIAPNPFQPRREFEPGELEDLATSIRQNGLLQPVLVRPAPEGSGAGWQLIAGERRWRAVTQLGWREVPAVVREADDRTLLVLALVENLQRSALSPLEEASAYRKLAEEFGLSHHDVAEVLGRDRSTVTNTLRLLQLPEPVRDLLADGGITAGHARALLGLSDQRRMAALAREAADAGWSVREVESRVQRERKDRAPRAEPGRDASERRLEEELQRALGTQVRIRSGRNARGRIEIPFRGAEDFERIFEILAGRSAAEIVS